jgi:hypothetical protein
MINLTKEQIKLGCKAVSIIVAVVGLGIIFKTSPIAVILVVVGAAGFYFTDKA